MPSLEELNNFFSENLKPGIRYLSDQNRQSDSLTDSMWDREAA